MTAHMPVAIADILGALGGPNQDLSNDPTTSSEPCTPTLVPPPYASGAMVAAEIQSALQYLSPDSPRGDGSLLGPDGQPSGGYWLGCVWAIRRALGAKGEDLVREWSQLSSAFSEEGFEQAWAGYEADHPNPVTIRSLYSLARQLGWPGSASHTLRPIPSTTRFHLLDRTDILAIPAIKWVVKGLFPKTGIAAVYGPSSSGKSFLCFDLGVAIAGGTEWFGRRTTASSVVYVMLEGEAGLRNRLVAGEQSNQKEIPKSFRAIIQAFNLNNPQDVEDLAATLPREGVVIIDTFNRATTGLEENSGKDMGMALAGMKRLQEVTGGLVIVVHHTGKNTEKGLRGHSSLHAALDGAIEVIRSTNGRDWKAAKVKDGADGLTEPFGLRIVHLGTDDDGDPISSCAVYRDTQRVRAPREPTGKNQRPALAAVRGAIAQSLDVGLGGCSSETHCLKVEEAIELVASTLGSVVPSKRRNYARTLVDKLIENTFVFSGIEADGVAWLWNG